VLLLLLLLLLLRAAAAAAAAAAILMTMMMRKGVWPPGSQAARPELRLCLAAVRLALLFLPV